MMKEDKQGHDVTVPPKLRQFLANLAAILAGPYDARRATKKQIQQLGGAIIDHRRMVSQFYSHQPVGVEVNELAFRFRETTHNVVTALVLLEKEGRARVLGSPDIGHWVYSPRIIKEAFTRHEEQRRG